MINAIMSSKFVSFDSKKLIRIINSTIITGNMKFTVPVMAMSITKEKQNKKRERKEERSDSQIHCSSTGNTDNKQKRQDRKRKAKREFEKRIEVCLAQCKFAGKICMGTWLIAGIILLARTLSKNHDI